MLPEVVWSMPPKGTFNLHASLLPQYRGAAPINHAIINGETETGLTTFLLDKEIDTGEIIIQEKVTIEENETAGTLHDKLMLLGNKVVVDTIKIIEEGRVQSQSQEMIIERDNLQLKPAPKIFKEDCLIDWSLEGKRIVDFVRGLSPYPAAWSRLLREGTEFSSAKIFRTSFKAQSHSEAIGSIRTDHRTTIEVACADGWISIEELQIAGKKRMTTRDLLLGFRDIDQLHFA
jgi:methionyl-tRNA formyltransferase